MDCRNCTKHKGDCGHHFIDGDEHMHYDIPVESACDRYGDCSFYTERRNKFQIQIDLLNEKDIELADLNVGVLREALECALRNERKE